MAGKYLGPAFDIHGGGVDLRFPHHENEQAQSRAAGHPFASYWLHNAWITTAGEKMSKSLGNSLLIPAVLQRVRGIELRYYMVAAHYRSHVEFSFEALDDAAGAFRRIEGFLERAGVTGRRRRAARGVRGRDGRRPRYAGRGGRDPRRRARGQQGAGRRAMPAPYAASAGWRSAPCSTCSGSTRPTRRGARRPAPTTSASPRRSTRSSSACSPSAARPARQGLRPRRRDPRPAQGRRHRARGHPRRSQVDTGE